MANKKTRSTLEKQFASGKIPTENNFAELIASGINQMDDGLQKAADTPLAIRTTIASDAADGTKDLILLFDDFQLPDPQWRIRLRSGGLELSRSAHADFLIDNNGNVGIGTINPLGPLSIGDSSVDKSDGFLVIGKKDGSSGRHFRMGFDENFNFTLGDYGSNNKKAEVWKKSFAVHWEAPDSSFYLDRAGNVGIGTNKPNTTLDVNGQVKASSLRVEHNVSIGALETFEVDAPNISGGRFSINKQGYVGIGNISPLGPLSIGSSSVDNSDGFLVIGKRKGAANRHFRMGFDDGFNFTIGDFGDANSARQWKKPFAINYGAPDSSFYISNEGNVGVGTTDPKQKLHIYRGYAMVSANANTEYAKGLLSRKDVANSTSLIGGVWGDWIHFYWKSERGELYNLAIQGSRL